MSDIKILIDGKAYTVKEAIALKKKLDDLFCSQNKDGLWRSQLETNICDFIGTPADDGNGNAKLDTIAGKEYAYETTSYPKSIKK